MCLYDKERKRVNIVTIRPSGGAWGGIVEHGICGRARP